MKNYAVGFCFTMDGKRVALIRKNKPVEAIGKLLPIGGHIEPGEAPRTAQNREFLEETGVPIPNWDRYVTVEGKGWRMECFRAYNDDVQFVRSVTDEEVALYGVQAALSREDLFHDVGWLMLLAQDHRTRAGIVVLESEAW